MNTPLNPSAENDEPPVEPASPYPNLQYFRAIVPPRIGAHIQMSPTSIVRCNLITNPDFLKLDGPTFLKLCWHDDSGPKFANAAVLTFVHAVVMGAGFPGGYRLLEVSVQGTTPAEDEQFGLPGLTPKILRSRPEVTDVTIESMADALYTRYCRSVGGRAFNGDTLPTWKEMAADPGKLKQVTGWREAAEEAFAHKLPETPFTEVQIKPDAP